MSAAAVSRAWIVAASIGVVEALKDQGICRWNHTIRSLHQCAKNNLRSNLLPSSSSAAAAAASSSSTSSASISAPSASSSDGMIRLPKLKKMEMCMDKTMNLSCWGPSTVRF